MLFKILSGGQTGVDRAALDVAIQLKIPHGGWCPKKRRAEDGKIPDRYLLKETVSQAYEERTQLNVRKADATLILVAQLPISVHNGTLLTLTEIQKQQKPHLVVDLSTPHDIQSILNWIKHYEIKILNIAGPRESQSPGIYQLSFDFLKKLLDQ